MAIYEAGTNSPQAVKVWQKGLDAVALKETSVSQFTGSSNAIVQMKDELEKGAGDRVRMSLRHLATGDGRTEGQVLEGFEESINLSYDDLTIGELFHAIRFRRDGMTNQRVPYEVREEAFALLKDWAADRHDEIFFNVLAGYTPANSLAGGRNGFNTIVDYVAADRIEEASNTADEDYNAAAESLTTDRIRAAVLEAKTRDFPLRTVKVFGRDCYVLFVHPKVAMDLKEDLGGSVADFGWSDFMSNAVQGGSISESPFVTGALGVIEGVLIVENSRVPNGVNSSTGAAISTVYRNVLCGAQAAAMAYGRFQGQFDRFKWVEETFDYGRQMGVSAGFIYGMKRCIYDGRSYGSLLLPAYTAR